MNMKVLLLLSSFVCTFAGSRPVSAVCSVSENPDTADVFSDYDVFYAETLIQTLQKCYIWYDREQIQQILLYEILKTTEKFEKLVKMPLKYVAQLHSAAQVLTMLPNIYTLCVAYLKTGGVYTDILDHQGNPIDFDPFVKQLLDKMDPWLRRDKAAFFKAQITLPFLQRMLKAFAAMSAEQYNEFITIAFRPFTAECLMSLSRWDINKLFDECQQETHCYLQAFEPKVIDTCSDGSETPDQDSF
jgi:hypothetical protein